MTRPTNEQDVLDPGITSRALDALPEVERVRTAMELAAFFLEYAAYEMALDSGSDDVAEIILMAARLDGAAKRIDDTALSRASARHMRKM